jgi:hypothetical protein
MKFIPDYNCFYTFSEFGNKIDLPYHRFWINYFLFVLYKLNFCRQQLLRIFEINNGGRLLNFYLCKMTHLSPPGNK